jgi:hypothetical protein
VQGGVSSNGRTNDNNCEAVLDSRLKLHIDAEEESSNQSIDE